VLHVWLNWYVPSQLPYYITDCYSNTVLTSFRAIHHYNPIVASPSRRVIHPGSSTLLEISLVDEICVRLMRPSIIISCGRGIYTHGGTVFTVLGPSGIVHYSETSQPSGPEASDHPSTCETALDGYYWLLSRLVYMHACLVQQMHRDVWSPCTGYDVSIIVVCHVNIFDLLVQGTDSN
jgi:hypothetical protein